MSEKKRKILIVCRANVTRSKIAIPIFNRKAKELGIEGKLDFRSAGIRSAFPAAHDYANIALRRAGYDPIADETPRQINSELSQWADLIFAINSEVVASLRRSYKTDSTQLAKLKLLPSYGSNLQNPEDIFDPRYLLVSPNDEISRKEPKLKKAAAISLYLFPFSITGWAISTFTPYVPFSVDSHQEEITSLYSRTIKELEPCVDGTLKRMQLEGFV